MGILHILLFFFSAQTASAGTPSVSVDKLSLEQKVGQLFIFGFPGKKLTPELQKTIKTLKPGALIIFGRNIETLKQIAEFNSQLQASSLRSSGIPLFLAVDQEGGAVSRIRTSPNLPSAYTIGNTSQPTLAFQAGKVTGEILTTLGFNMNLAPVLDITDDKLNSFVGARSFSDSPHKISSMGVAFAQGLAETKVIPVAKHYPGHGPIALDTHQMMPERRSSYSDLAAADLIPFTQFANSNIESGVMVAHISFPNIDSSQLPATYSHKLISEILVDQLKYKGLIMTDDIEMAGAGSFKHIEDRAVAAIRAGNDLIMVGWSPRQQKRAIKGVIAAVRKGVIPMERINRSVKKILALKAEYAASSASRNIANTIGLKEALRKIPYNSVFNEIIASYFKNLPGLKEVTTPLQKVHVVSAMPAFITSFRRWAKINSVSSSATASGNIPLAQKDLIVYHVSNLKALEEVRDIPHDVRKKIIVITSHPKAHVLDKASFLDVIEVYSNHPNLGGYAAEAINRHKQNLALLGN